MARTSYPASSTVLAIARRVKGTKIAWDNMEGGDVTERNKLHAAWEAWMEALGIALLEAQGISGYPPSQADAEAMGFMNDNWAAIQAVSCFGHSLDGR
jgi:hypothetical protein